MINKEKIKKIIQYVEFYNSRKPSIFFKNFPEYAFICANCGKPRGWHFTVSVGEGVGEGMEIRCTRKRKSNMEMYFSGFYKEDVEASEYFKILCRLKGLL